MTGIKIVTVVSLWEGECTGKGDKVVGKLLHLALADLDH